MDLRMRDLPKLLEEAAILGISPKVQVFNSSRGHYRGTNEEYKSALRPPPDTLIATAGAVPDFTYSALEPGKGNIRLVVLHPPTEKKREIHCTLEHVSLASSPTYCALSYTWGSPEAVFPIILNGCRFAIALNLALALGHLRHPNRSLVLWIDSLCIKQSDNEEKLSQVSQMGSIYSDAAMVLAWLGAGTPESEKAILKMDDLSCRHREMMVRVEASKGDVKGMMMSEIKGLVESLVVGYEEDADVPINLILHLLQREYWTRVWIQQEIALAKNILFICGSTDIDRRHFIPALQVIMFCTAFRSRGSMTSHANHWDLVGLGAYVPESLIQYSDKKSNESLTELLLKLRSGRGHRLKATNSKDYIYGFLGLANPETTFGIVPDYVKNTTQLYTKVSQAMLGSGDLDVLRYAGGDRSKSETKDLPSWVIDWSLMQRSPMTISFGHIEKGLCFSASGSSMPSCTFPSEGVLRLAGVQVDVIETIGPTWEYQTDLNEFSRKKFASYVEELETLTKDGDEYGFESTWRVPVTDFEGVSSSSFSTEGQVLRRATEKYSLAGFSTLVGYDGPLENLSASERDQSYSYLRFMNDHANSRPTFATRSGLIGLAHAKNFDVSSKDGLRGVGDTKEVEPGDTLCLILGASIPFILREEADGKYRLLCEAYVQGMMDGEVMKKPPTIKDFDIV